MKRFIHVANENRKRGFNRVVKKTERDVLNHVAKTNTKRRFNYVVKINRKRCFIHAAKAESGVSTALQKQTENDFSITLQK